MYVFYLPWFRPIHDDLDLARIHGKTICGKDEPKVLDSVFGEETLVGLGVKCIELETPEYFPYMLDVIVGIVGKNKDVVEIDDNIDI